MVDLDSRLREWACTSHRRALLSRLIAFALAALPASGQVAQSSAHSDWVFGTSFGGGWAGGGYGEVLETPINYDLSLAHTHASWRFGAGLTFGSLAMKAPYQEQLEWAHHDIYLMAQRDFLAGKRVRPYLQARIGLTRIDPRSEIFQTIPFDSAAPEANRVETANGISFTVQPGVEIGINASLSVDFGVFQTWFNTSAYNLAPIGGGTVSSGTETGLRLGLTWRPPGSTKAPETLAERPLLDSLGGIRPLPPESDTHDAWGVRKSWGWATGEMLAINYVAAAYNSYLRGVFFSQISPRSFWQGIQNGFSYDDNEFKNNQFNHPFNGSAYFNAARANGLSFWPSALMSVAGAFVWECCGETHHMSYNDMIATGIGGFSSGEALFRASSLVLDNTSTGLARGLEEFAAFLIDPIREVNRVASGNAWRVQGNPSDPFEKRPPYLGVEVLGGLRLQGQGSSATENLKPYAFGELWLDFGSTITNKKRRPFDHFDMVLQLNAGEKETIGDFLVRGDLFSKALGDESHPKHAIALVQGFDYTNNSAYVWGGQTIGGSFTSAYHPSSKLEIRTRFEGSLLILGGVSSEYSYLAEVPVQSRLREYDYGPGAGFSAETWLRTKHWPLFYLAYRFQWIDVANGSVFNANTDGGIGSSANHYLQFVTARLLIPIRGPMGLGADASDFVRDSYYSNPDFADVRARHPEFRFFLGWNLAD